MDDVVRFDAGDRSVLVEVQEDSFGIDRVARDDGGVLKATKTLTEALEVVRPAAEAVAEAFATMQPQQTKIVFGIKLSAEAGALLAKVASDAHFEVSLEWERPARSTDKNG